MAVKDLQHASELGAQPEPVEEAATAATTTVTEDGLVIDEHGVIVGDQIPDDLKADAEKAEKPDQVVSADFVDYVLRRVQKADAETTVFSSLMVELEDRRQERLAELAAADPELTVIDRRISSLTAQKNRAVSKAAYLRAAYLEPLKRFALSVTSEKVRSWKSKKGFGTLSLRSTAARPIVADEALAVQIARQLKWEGAVKETFQISALPEDVKKEILESPEAAEHFGLAVEPAKDTLTIKS